MLIARGNKTKSIETGGTNPAEPFRVLCYSPYNAWQLHAMWEMTLIHALRLRGAEVHYLFCDALYSDCDLHWQATAQRQHDSCLKCLDTVTRLAAQMGVTYGFLGRFTRPEDFAAARAWADSIPQKSMFDAMYRAWPIGEWARSSMHQHFRSAVLDLTNPEVEAGCRSYLYSVLVAALAAERTLDCLRPDALLLFNGKFSNIRPFKELALAQGIRVVGHERGLLKNSLRMLTEHDADALSQFHRMWELWKDVPLSAEELEMILAYLHDRRHGRNQSWHAFSPPPGEDHDALRHDLRLRDGAAVWAMFPSSDDESAAAKERHGTFGRQDPWIEQTVHFAKLHPELELVIRAHPNIRDRNRGLNQRQYDYFDRLKQTAPANVHVVMPEDPVSSYSLGDIADLVLIYNSTIGLEMAAGGAPVVMASNGWFHGCDFVQSVRERAEYAPLLEKNLRGEVQTDPLEIRRGALRFAYGAYYRLNVPFPLVQQVTPHTGRPAYHSLDALRPGRYPGLDRICRMILDGESVLPIPSDTERNRLHEEENIRLRATQTVSAAL